MNNPNSVEGTGGKPELYPSPPKELPETEEDGFATVYPCEDSPQPEGRNRGLI